jgi:hypothetical protein
MGGGNCDGFLLIGDEISGVIVLSIVSTIVVFVKFDVFLVFVVFIDDVNGEDIIFSASLLATEDCIGLGIFLIKEGGGSVGGGGGLRDGSGVNEFSVSLSSFSSVSSDI